MANGVAQDKDEEHPIDKALDTLLASLEPKGSAGEAPNKRSRKIHYQETRANSSKAERRARFEREQALHAARKAKRDLAADPTMSKRKQKAIRRREAVEFVERKAIKREAAKVKAEADKLGETAGEAAVTTEQK